MNANGQQRPANHGQSAFLGRRRGLFWRGCKWLAPFFASFLFLCLVGLVLALAKTVFFGLPE